MKITMIITIAIVGIIYLIIRRIRIRTARLLKEVKTDYLHFMFLKKHLTTDRYH